MRTLYPYDVLVGDVRVAVSSVTVDGKSLSTNYINPDLLEIQFADLESGRWSEATIRVIVTAPATELDGNVAWMDVRTVLQVTCDYTNTRVSTVLNPDPHTPARWEGTVDLERDLWFGRVQLRAVVVATVDGIPHRQIGCSDPWTVSFDDLPRSPVHGSIRVQWSDFANDDDRPYLQGFKSQPYYLRLDPDDPTLLLNSGFDGLQALLVDRRRRPRSEQALHDSTRANIASDVWKAMFLAALDVVERDPDTRLPEWPAEGWRQIVLRTLLVRLYPDLAPDDALVTAADARESGEGSADLLERLLPAAAAQVRVSQLLRDGIALLQKDSDKEDDQ